MSSFRSTPGRKRLLGAGLTLVLLAQVTIPGLAAEDEERVAHVISRLSFGAKPGEIEAVEKEGVENYIRRQLHPDSQPLPADLEKLGQLDALAKDPVYLFLNYGKPAIKALAKSNGQGDKDDKEAKKIIGETYRRMYQEAALARVRRAVESPRELQEVMTDFWFNHFNISQEKGLDHVWIGSYEERAIRPYALGRFRDLLGATAHHAGMLFYLDNWQNTAASYKEERVAPAFAERFNKDKEAKLPARRNRFQGINENYARELMELHTLGVDGGYSQKDVQELARVLTGLGLPKGAGGGRGPGGPSGQEQMMFAQNQGAGAGAGAAVGARRRLGRGAIIREYGGGETIVGNRELGYYFDPSRHDQGEKVLLGKVIKAEGEAEIEKVLDLLARHPSTARHISFKLAQYFVADKPPQTLVDKLSKSFSESDGDIAAVLNTLFHSSEFYDKNYRGKKFKSPYRYVISSLRATDSRVEDVKPLLNFLKQTGQPLYQCLTPDGYKNTKEAWLNPDNLINRLNYATVLGTSRYPGITTRVKDPSQVADACTTDLSAATVSAVKQAPSQLKAALVLGSPEFMMY